MNTLPTFQREVVQFEHVGSFETSKNRPIPVPSSTQILTKVSIVALNRCNWKMPARVYCPGAVDGADYSGTVVALGESAALTSSFNLPLPVISSSLSSWCRHSDN